MTAWGRGRALGPEKTQRIVQLLSGSELSIPEIAERLQCSKGAVSSVNRKNKVRLYNGHRTCWTLSSEEQAGVAIPVFERKGEQMNHGVIWI